MKIDGLDPLPPLYLSNSPERQYPGHNTPKGQSTRRYMHLVEGVGRLELRGRRGFLWLRGWEGEAFRQPHWVPGGGKMRQIPPRMSPLPHLHLPQSILPRATQ